MLLSPFRWQGRILRKLGAGSTALSDLRALFAELRAHEGWFAILLKELQPTARTGIAVRLSDGRVRAEIIHGHFASKGIADATSYLLQPDGDIESMRVGRQTSMVTLERGKQNQHEKARLYIRENLIQLAPIFIKQKHMLGDEFSMLDVAIAPLLSSTRDNMRTSCCW